MHELGVVFHIIKQVNEIAKENDVKEVKTIVIDLGEVSTVVPYLLEDCFNWAKAKEELMKNCNLKINIIKAITTCNDCGHEYSTVEYAKVCPKCGSENTVLKVGNEFIIKDIEVI